MQILLVGPIFGTLHFLLNPKNAVAGAIVALAMFYSLPFMTVGYLLAIFLGANIAFGFCESVIKRMRNEQEAYNAYIDSKSDPIPYPAWHNELIKNKKKRIISPQQMRLKENMKMYRMLIL